MYNYLDSYVDISHLGRSFYFQSLKQEDLPLSEYGCFITKISDMDHSQQTEISPN